MELIGSVLMASNENTSLNSQLDTISKNINGLSQALSSNNSNELVARLGLIAKKLHAIEHSAGLANTGEMISQQLGQLVEGVRDMHSEIARASAAEVQKAEWLTRRMGKKG
jgi:uncharacterized coiled-coil DUF342 family protein